VAAESASLASRGGVSNLRSMARRPVGSRSWNGFMSVMSMVTIGSAGSPFQYRVCKRLQNQTRMVRADERAPLEGHCKCAQCLTIDDQWPPFLNAPFKRPFDKGSWGANTLTLSAMPTTCGSLGRAMTSPIFLSTIFASCSLSPACPRSVGMPDAKSRRGL